MELQAVFVRGQAEPVAYFSDADQAQRWRRAEHGDNAVVLPVEASVSTSALKDAAETAAASFPAPAAAPTASADDVLRGEIRAQLELEARRERLTAEVRKEMTSDAKAERADESAATTTVSGGATTAPSRTETRSSGR